MTIAPAGQPGARPSAAAAARDVALFHASFVADDSGQSGTAAAMVRQVLRNIFRDHESARLFVVLRNGRELPERLSGNDIDVSVLPGVAMRQAVDFICARAREVDWIPTCVNRRRRTTGFSIVKATGSAIGSAVHIDVFDGITAFGVPLLPASLLEAESSMHGNVRHLNERGSSLATLAHHIASGGSLTKDVYVAELARVLRSETDRAWLLEQATRVLGGRVVDDLCDTPAQEKQHALRRPSRLRQIHALWTASRSAPGRVRGAAAGVAEYLVGQLPSLLYPPGIVGCRGDRVRGLPALELTASFACRVAPLAMLTRDVRARAVFTENSVKHQRHIEEIWSRGVLLRWMLPSLFLWIQAKRGRIVVLERLPLGLRLARAVAAPAWITTSDRQP